MAARAITAVSRAAFGVAKWGVWAIAALMLYEVVSRYAAAAPTSWAPELATLIFGPYFLLGGPYLLHLGGHVAVDIVSERATGGAARVLDVVAALLALVFGAILLWFAGAATRLAILRVRRDELLGLASGPLAVQGDAAARRRAPDGAGAGRDRLRPVPPIRAGSGVMEGNLVLIGMFAALIALMLTGAGLAFVLGAIAFLATIAVWGPSALIVTVLNTFETMGSEALMAIPALHPDGVGPAEVRHHRGALQRDGALGSPASRAGSPSAPSSSAPSWRR